MKVTCWPFHQFDPETHRCVRCNRWQRGFAPVKTVAKPRRRGECQICERRLAIDAPGRLMHHGYERPGDGYIVGDCPGVGHLPFPETTALQIMLEGLTNRETMLVETLKGLLKRKSVHLVEYRAGERSRSMVEYLKPKAKAPTADHAKWGAALFRFRGEQESSLRWTQQHMDWTRARIAKADDIRAANRKVKSTKS